MISTFRYVLMALLLGLIHTYPAQGSPRQDAEPIRYRLSFDAAQNHYLEVEATYPTGGRASVDLMMAVWTPGSYLVREYARHVEAVEAEGRDGPLSISKTRKNRWRVETGGGAEVRVRYRVYGREMTVRNNWVEADFAMLNGAPTFLTLVGEHHRPHDIELRLPEGWKTTMTGLPEHPDGRTHHYLAPDFDIVVDSPIVAGNPAVYEFAVQGVPHYLVNVGETDVWDGPKSARDAQTIVEATYDLWGVIPYEKYVFLNMITEAGGGLEHLNSTLLMTSRWRSRIPKDHREWLGLVSHEFFHAWNIKKLRPVELGPFDYENEVYTRSLWIGEGITSYYGPIVLRRAGLSTQKQYLESLSDQIESLQTTPGRLVHPVELSSYDAWIKQYRRDENSPNTTISYYTKGAVVGFLLDAKIRKLTGNEKSLDDMMRLAYQRYSDERGFTRQEFRETASEVAGTDLSDWFQHALETTNELSYDEALGFYGLRFKDPDEKKKDGEDQEEDEEKDQPKAWLGLGTSNNQGRLVVTGVRRETPGYDHGFNVGDEILAVEDYRVSADEWKERLEQYKPSDRASILIARREKLRRIDVVFGTEPKKLWQLEVDPDATEEQKERLKTWLDNNPPA